MSAIKEVQSWSAEGYARNARFVADLGQPVLDLLAPQAGERILDLGCGDGALTAKLVAAGATVVGADASAELVAAARALGLDARIADGQALAFDAEFDAVFTNAALHWMRDADAVIAGVKRALKPGGRFVGEFGGHGNVAAIATALIAALSARGIDGAARVPWFFSTPAEYAAKLEAQGFTVETIGRCRARRRCRPACAAGWTPSPARSSKASTGRRGSRCWTRSRRCWRPACATSPAAGPPTTSGCASPRRWRHSQARRPAEAVGHRLTWAWPDKGLDGFGNSAASGSGACRGGGR
ncbi:class I SAM-dependent methyltransferase [Inquilinus sp. 2KB_12]